MNVWATADSATEVTVTWELPENIGTGISNYNVQLILSSAPTVLAVGCPNYRRLVKRERR